MAKLNTIFVVTLLFFLHNCSHYYYAPNAHNVPLFEEKDELRMQISRSGGKEYEGADISLAYAFDDHFAVMGNGFSASGSNKTDWGRGRFGEMGVGYFNQTSDGIIYELFNGFGFGYVKNNYGERISSLVKYNRYFFQPNLGYKFKFFSFAMSSRLCLLNFYKIEYDAGITGVALEDLIHLTHNRFSLLAEPAVTVRFGGDPVSIQAQLVHSLNLTSSALKQETINLNLGIFLSF